MSANTGKYNVKHRKLNVSLIQHPADRAASEAVLKSDAFQKALDIISKYSIVKQMNGVYRATFAEITPEVSPVISEMLEEAMEMYDVMARPIIFLNRQYELSAELSGVHEPFLLLSTELLRRLDEKALWGIISAEVAGIKSGYCKIKMVESICNLSGGLHLFPAGVAKSLELLFENWHKYAKFSFDRMILFATEDFNTAVRTILMEDAPDDILQQVDFTDPSNGYMKQCLEFQKGGGKMMKVLRGVDTVISADVYDAARYLALYDFYQKEYYDLLEEFDD